MKKILTLLIFLTLAIQSRASLVVFAITNTATSALDTNDYKLWTVTSIRNTDGTFTTGGSSPVPIRFHNPTGYATNWLVTGTWIYTNMAMGFWTATSVPDNSSNVIMGGNWGPNANPYIVNIILSTNGASTIGILASNIAPNSGPIPLGNLTVGSTNVAGNLLIDAAGYRWISQNGNNLSNLNLSIQPFDAITNNRTSDFNENGGLSVRRGFALYPTTLNDGMTIQPQTPGYNGTPLNIINTNGTKSLVLSNNWTLYGDLGGGTNLNASNLASGTVPQSLLPTLVTTNNASTLSSGTVALNLLPSPVVTNGQFVLPPGIPQPVAWWTARSFASSNHWTTVARWPDLSSGHYDLLSSTANAGNLDLYGFNGQPGIYFAFNAGTSMGYTNTTLLAAHPELNTNLTVFVVWKNTSSQSAAWTLLNDDNNGLEFEYQAVQGNRYGAGSSAWYAFGQVVVYETTEGYNLPDISAFRYTGSTKNYCGFVNGHPIYNANTALYPSVDAKNPLTMSGNFYVGSLFGRTQSFQGEVAELLIYNVALTDAQMVAMHDYLAGIYQRRVKNLVLDGDSITQGQEASAGEDLIKFSHTNLLSWAIDSVALPGNSALAQLVNQTNWVTAPKYSTGQNWISFLTGANDFGTTTPMTIAQVTTQLPITESNMLCYCTNAHSFGWRVLLCTLPSNLRMETNNARAQLNAWVLTNGVSDGVVDYSGLIPQLGSYQACTNGNYFQTNGATPQLHPLSAGYALMAPVLASALSAASAGTNFNGNFSGSFTGNFVATNGISFPTNSYPTIAAGANCAQAFVVTNLSSSARDFYVEAVFVASPAAGNTNFTVTAPAAFINAWRPLFNIGPLSTIAAGNLTGAAAAGMGVQWDSSTTSTFVFRQYNSTSALASTTNVIHFMTIAP